jgi:hypothetical protein
LLTDQKGRLQMAKFKATATIEVEFDVDEEDLAEFRESWDQDAFDETLSFEGYSVLGDIKLERLPEPAPA